jgi:hypothetical protein
MDVMLMVDPDGAASLSALEQPVTLAIKTTIEANNVKERMIFSIKVMSDLIG